jgi:biotin carboxyl carrier protein
MASQYKLKVNHQKELQLTEKEILDLNLVSTSTHSFHLLQEGVSYHINIIDRDFERKKYTLEINNKPYEVEISDELDLLIEQMGLEKNGKKRINKVTAPMPGLILEINVKEGAEVKENQQLLILEAMKMENSFTSPRNGVIKSIEVSQGQAVDKGQLLIEFE